MSKHTGNLYILPVSENTILADIFSATLSQLTKKEIKLIKSYKQIIFEAFLLIKEQTIYNKNCFFQIEEMYGLDIIKLAQYQKININLLVSKNNQKYFTLAFGREFASHINYINPLIVTVNINYNPANKKANRQQLERLKKFNIWCQDNHYRLLVKLTVPPTRANLKRVRGKQNSYVNKIMPNLILKAIQEFHQVGIEPDIWSLAMFTNQKVWLEIIDLIRDGENREQVGILVFSQEESYAKIKQWINSAPRHLLNGFIVGPIIFTRPLQNLYEKKINRKQAIKEIAKNYLEIIRYWEKN